MLARYILSLVLMQYLTLLSLIPMQSFLDFGVDKEPDVHTLAQSLSKANVTYKDVYVSVVEEHNAALSTDS